jgi:hypothetical protein
MMPTSALHQQSLAIAMIRDCRLSFKLQLQINQVRRCYAQRLPLLPLERRAFDHFVRGIVYKMQLGLL